MSSHYNQLKTLLATKGFSITASRQLVFETIEQRSPITFKQLLMILHGQVDRASIYRIIDTFKKAGVIETFSVGKDLQLELSDSFKGHHHHLVCTNCGKVVEFADNPQLDVFIKATAFIHQFEAHQHQLEITGRCASCDSAP